MLARICPFILGKLACYTVHWYAKILLKYLSVTGGALNLSTVVNTLLVINSIIMIILVLLQSGKREGLSGAISGGAEQLFGKKKARGIELDRKSKRLNSSDGTMSTV